MSRKFSTKYIARFLCGQLTVVSRRRTSSMATKVTHHNHELIPLLNADGTTWRNLWIPRGFSTLIWRLQFAERYECVITDYVFYFTAFATLFVLLKWFIRVQVNCRSIFLDKVNRLGTEYTCSLEVSIAVQTVADPDWDGWAISLPLTCWKK